jgi:hypothetical protein
MTPYWPWIVVGIFIAIVVVFEIRFFIAEESRLKWQLENNDRMWKEYLASHQREIAEAYYRGESHNVYVVRDPNKLVFHSDADNADKPARDGRPATTPGLIQAPRRIGPPKRT